MSSRALYSLAVAGNAPKIFAKCNRYGLPIYAVVASSCFAPLCYLDCSTQTGVAFNWFVSLTNTSGYTSWIVCCIVYLRFRKARQAQGVTVPYTSKIQPYAGWICMFTFFVLLLCNGFTVFYPGQLTASGFLTRTLEFRYSWRSILAIGLLLAGKIVGPTSRRKLIWSPVLKRSMPTRKCGLDWR
jgi:amino acid transporter